MYFFSDKIFKRANYNAKTFSNFNLNFNEKGNYKKYSTSKVLADFENSARLQKLGLWYDKTPVAPWDWRRK